MLRCRLDLCLCGYPSFEGDIRIGCYLCAQLLRSQKVLITAVMSGVKKGEVVDCLMSRLNFESEPTQSRQNLKCFSY